MVFAAMVNCLVRSPEVRQSSPIAKGIPARSSRLSRSAVMNASVFFAFMWLILASWCAACSTSFGSGVTFARRAWKSTSGTFARSSVRSGPATGFAVGGVGSKSFVGVFGSILKLNRCGTGREAGCVGIASGTPRGPACGKPGAGGTICSAGCGGVGTGSGATTGPPVEVGGEPGGCDPGWARL